VTKIKDWFKDKKMQPSKESIGYKKIYEDKFEGCFLI